MARKPFIIRPRKTASRLPKPKVLIVCEGSKTEPDYFDLLKKEYHLLSVVVVKASTIGSAPISVVESAVYLNQQQIKLYGESAAFEKVYCVYDTDEHTSLDEAKRLIKANKFNGVISNPCFEYWLLLHFKYTRALFLSSGDKTAATMCQKQLKQYLPDYQKTEIFKYFDLLLDTMPVAIANSTQGFTDAIKTNEYNPSTNMHDLIMLLKSFQK